MNRLLKITTIFLLSLTGVLAQDEAPQNLPIGSAVLQKRIAPVAAHWTITSTQANSGNVAAAGNFNAPTSGAAKTVFVVSKDITRLGKLVRNVTSLSNGRSIEIWTKGDGAIAILNPDNQIYRISFDHPFSMPFFQQIPDFAATDFPELAWVLPLTATREATISGQKCWIFETNSENKRMVVILQASGLPALLMEENVTKAYAYPSAPSTLEMPEKFRQEFQKFIDEIRNINAARPRRP